jgi:sterol 3beta-glucosyltransferase
LIEFLQTGPPPVYVGFGSMFMNGGTRKTELVVAALRMAGQRGVLATGWGGLTADTAPEGLFVLDAVPHDWLFPQTAAVVHHGGAGTTGAALRAGKPMVICPFVGDQPFWGRRVAALGVGPAPIAQRRLTAERLAQAISQAVADQDMRQRAAALGETIRAEDGVGVAVAYINRHLV